jgi:putative component of membrane protein insertase Oxa1/YidC/SpoIIIJ protein YidD
MVVRVIRALFRLSAGWRFGVLDSQVAALAACIITLYQWFLSPFLSRECLFQPSCSQYAKESIQAYGWNEGVPKFLAQYDDCCGTYDVRFHKTGVVLIGRSGTHYPAHRVSISIAQRLTMGLPPDHIIGLNQDESVTQTTII